MDDLGLSTTLSSYVFLGLSLSIGLLVYFLIRDANRRKKEREDRESQRTEDILRQFAEEQRKVKREEGQTGGTAEGAAKPGDKRESKAETPASPQGTARPGDS